MLIVIDTETTGLTHEPDARPWQIAAVVLAPDGREIATFNGRGCPDVWNAGADEALAVSGMTIAYVQSLPQIAPIALAFAAFLSAFPDAYLTAYRIEFDREMLRRVGVVSNRWTRCLKEAAAEYKGHPVRLIEIAAELGIAHPNAHDALADARTASAVARVFGLKHFGSNSTVLTTE